MPPFFIYEYHRIIFFNTWHVVDSIQGNSIHDIYTTGCIVYFSHTEMENQNKMDFNSNKIHDFHLPIYTVFCILSNLRRRFFEQRSINSIEFSIPFTKEHYGDCVAQLPLLLSVIITDDEIKKTKSINFNHLLGCNIRYHPRKNSNIEGDAKRI